MLLAASVEAAETGGSRFDPFDIFIILFTILAVIALVRSVKLKNKFAAAFSTLVLLVFLFTDAVMVLNWAGKLEDVLAMIGLTQG